MGNFPSSGTGTHVAFSAGSLYGRTGDNFTTADGQRLAATTGGAEGTDKLWLPIWSGEVMRAYDQYRMFEPMVESRSIASGRVAEFPITGTMALKPAWGAGEELVGNTNDHASKTIGVQLDARPIATHFELDNIDLMISQWEYRSELARQAGQTMANARDLQIASFLVRGGLETLVADDPRLFKAGNDAAGGTGWRNTLKNGPIYGTDFAAALADLGVSGSSAAARTDAALALLAALEDFMVHLQEINAPTEGVYCAVTPRAFQDIRALGVARDADDLAGGTGRPYFGGVAEAGGLGAQLTQGMNNLSDSLEYMGVRIVKTTHLPQTDASVDVNQVGEARYNLDCSDATTGAGVRAIIWQSGAVASLSKLGLKVDTVDDIRRNTTFTVASMLAGTGVLKPECCALVTGKVAATRAALATAVTSFVPELTGAGAIVTNTE